ncbi:hypothetical protein ACFE04_019467 [Oxalis oulophora]
MGIASEEAILQFQVLMEPVVMNRRDEYRYDTNRQIKEELRGCRFCPLCVRRLQSSCLPWWLRISLYLTIVAVAINRRRNQPSSPVLRQSSSPNRDLLFNSTTSTTNGGGGGGGRNGENGINGELDLKFSVGKCIYDKITEEEIESCPICDIDLGCAPLEKLSLTNVVIHVLCAIGECLESMRLLLFDRAYQVNGHMKAKLDPLNLEDSVIPDDLDPSLYGFTDADLKIALPVHPNMISWLPMLSCQCFLAIMMIMPSMAVVLQDRDRNVEFEECFGCVEKQLALD